MFKTDELSTLVTLAFEYGPFFFAVLLLVFLMRWAHGNYRKVCERKTPAPSQEECRTHKRVYFAMMVAGLALVGASVASWFMRPSTRVVKGVITNVESYAALLGSDQVFFRPERKVRREDPSLEYRDEHFVVLSRGDPGKGPVRITYQKEPAAPVTLFLTLPSGLRAEHDELPFRLMTDSLTGEVRLEAYRPVAPDSQPKSVAGRFSLIGTLSAQQPARAIRISPATRYTLAQNCPVRLDMQKSMPPTLAALRDPCSLPGSKLLALDSVKGGSPRDLEALFSRDLGGEPGLITLLDLTRHGDRQVSAAARAVLQKGRGTAYIRSGLATKGPVRALAESALFRIPVGEARAVLNDTTRLAPGRRDQLIAEVTKGIRTRVVLATASASGDRYYVKATWASNNTTVRNCLTSLFNNSLLTERSLDQERAMMAGRNERYVYWYTKEWAMGIFDGIRGCGATSAFARL